MKRREFLLQTSGLLAMTAVQSLRIARAQDLNGSFPNVATDQTGLSARQWQTIVAVQNHMLPSEQDSPGASDVNAETYLKWVMSAPDTRSEARDFLRDGVIGLESLARKLTSKTFSQLNEEQTEQILRQYEQDHEGRHWLRQILEYVLEALLTDSVYGGNPEGVGWVWLGYQPGYKRPPADKRYVDLLKMREARPRGDLLTENIRRGGTPPAGKS